MLSNQFLPKDPTICVIGLGYVGLPLAVEFGKSYLTIGFEINVGRVKELQNGEKMPQPQQVNNEPVRTNGQDTILFIPKKNTDDREFLRLIGSEVLNIQFEAENMSLDNRDEYIINTLKKLEKHYS